MATPVSALLPAIRQLVDDPLAEWATDHELLARFGESRDELAFAVIVARHGPMVLDVCRSVLTCAPDAEDAFQAAFLVLATKAGTIRKSESLAAWLHGVAYRVALKARTGNARRRVVEASAPQRESAGADAISWAEVQRVLHEELGRLPDRFRAPLVLCYLRGVTQDDAADQLGLSKGTLKRRLERGRALLRDRLVRRGLGPAAVLVGAAWPASASATLPTGLATNTTRHAVQYLTTPGSVPANVANLTTGALTAMSLTKMKSAMAVLLIGGALIAGGTGLAYLLGGEDRVGNSPGSGATTQKPDPDKKEAPPTAPVPRPKERQFMFESVKIPPSSLKVEMNAGLLLVNRKLGRDKEQSGLMLHLEIKNNSAESIKTSLAHEWGGGEWPSTSLYASVTPAKQKEIEPFMPVYLAGEDPDKPRAVTLAAGKTTDLSLRMDWPGTGSVQAKPLIGEPGQYVARFALVFEVDGKKQFVESGAIIEHDALALIDERDELKPLVDQALKAAGGVKKLHDLKAYTWTSRVKYADGGKAVIKQFIQLPDRRRVEEEREVAGKKSVRVSAWTGDKGWTKEGDGPVKELTEADVAEMKRSLGVSGFNQVLILLPHPGYRYFRLEESKVGDRSVVGIKVVSASGADMRKLYLDKETSRLLRFEMNRKGKDGKDELFEATLDDYREVGGIAIPHKQVNKYDGKAFAEIEVIEFQAADKLDDKLFEKP